MWVAFNKKGAVIKALQHGIPARQGSVGTFYIFAYFQDIDLSQYGICTITVKKPSGEFNSPSPMEKILLSNYENITDENMTVDELGSPLPPLFKYTEDETYTSSLPFLDGERYAGFRADFNYANLLDMEGTYKATIRLYGTGDLAGVIMVEGMISFYVEPSVMPESYEISPTIFEHIMTELQSKQDTLYSDTTALHTQNLKTINGQDLLGQGNIEIQGGGGGSGTAFESFPDGWPRGSSTTTAEFCAVVNADPDAYVGKAYLGSVSWSDLPLDGNAEVTVQIMSGIGTSGKVILLNCTSGNVSPYRWQYTYWNNGQESSYEWIGFVTTEQLAQRFTYVVTSTLPTASVDTLYKIYLIPSTNPVTENDKDEFITIRSGEGTELDPYTYDWEQIGSTTVDLSNYYTIQAVNSLLSNKQNTLVSGINIATINGTSLLGTDNLVVTGGEAIPNVVQSSNNITTNHLVVGANNGKNVKETTNFLVTESFNSDGFGTSKRLLTIHNSTSPGTDTILELMSGLGDGIIKLNGYIQNTAERIIAPVLKLYKHTLNGYAADPNDNTFTVGITLEWIDDDATIYTSLSALLTKYSEFSCGIFANGFTTNFSKRLSFIGASYGSYSPWGFGLYDTSTSQNSVAFKIQYGPMGAFHQRSFYNYSDFTIIGYSTIDINENVLTSIPS